MAQCTATAPRRQLKKKKLPLDKVRLDGDTQPRAGINTTLVSEYAKLYEDGTELPPVVVFFDGVDYWLADGFHRWHARNKTEIEGLSCEIHNGTVDDARWYSYAANQTHGQRRSNADKQKAAKAALLHPKGAGLSNVDIAAYVGVDEKTVRKYRKELEAASELPKVTERLGKDGKVYDTTNIGNKVQAEVAEQEPDDDVGGDDVGGLRVVREEEEPPEAVSRRFRALIECDIDQWRRHNPAVSTNLLAIVLHAVAADLEKQEADDE